MNHDPTLVGRLIYSARLARTKRAEMLSKHGIYSGQDLLLKSLVHEDGQTMGSLALNLDVKPPTITKMVTRMSAQNLVDRKNSPSDSRQSHVYITPQGMALSAKIDKAWKKADRQILKGVKRKQRRRFLKLVTMVEQNLATIPGVEDQQDENGKSG